MSTLLESVDKRTQLAGENRLELLLFHITDNEQLFGINVFKVKEIIRTPNLTIIPNSSNLIRGVSNIRGSTIPIIDFGRAVGYPPIKDLEDSFVIVSEFNNSVQGFLVDSVLKIVNASWEEIAAPPAGAGDENYLTAVMRYDNRLVEILDVEKILQEISPQSASVTKEKILEDKNKIAEKTKILICDDSFVARNQVKRVLEQLDVEVIAKSNGKEAWNYLLGQIEEGEDIASKIPLIVSDVEMPEMDGYKLTAEIKDHDLLKNIKVVLHTSLSGVFNNALAQKVNADKLVTKFEPDYLAECVVELIIKDLK